MRIQRRMLSLQLFITGLGCGQRMISIPHCIQQCLSQSTFAFFISKDLVRKSRCIFTGNQIPRYSSSAHHQLKIIDFGERLPSIGQAVKQSSLFIITQDDRMGQIERRLLTNLQTRRNTLQDRLFRCPNRCVLFLLIGIGFQIQHSHNTAPDSPILKRSFNIDIGHLVLLQAWQFSFHYPMNFRYFLTSVPTIKLRFRI